MIESSRKSPWPRQAWCPMPVSWPGRPQPRLPRWSSPRWTPQRSWWWRAGTCPGSRRSNHVWWPASTTEFQKTWAESIFLKYVCCIIDDRWHLIFSKQSYQSTYDVSQEFWSWMEHRWAVLLMLVFVFPLIFVLQENISWWKLTPLRSPENTSAASSCRYLNKSRFTLKSFIFKYHNYFDKILCFQKYPEESVGFPFYSTIFCS